MLFKTDFGFKCKLEDPKKGRFPMNRKSQLLSRLLILNYFNSDWGGGARYSGVLESLAPKMAVSITFK